MLVARLFESLPLVCPNCGAHMRLIAFITEAAPAADRAGARTACLGRCAGADAGLGLAQTG